MAKENFTTSVKKRKMAEMIELLVQTHQSIVPFMGMPLSKLDFTKVDKFIKELRQQYNEMYQ